MAGSMGYGLPASVGIKRLYPDRTVLCVAGDGDFLMNGQEFMTAVQYDLPIIVVLMDNGTYGTIRMHQEREYPTRVVGTDLRNPDFAAYARAFGGYGAPAGVAAKIAAPHRMVLAFSGDGDFLMNGQEIATAVQYDAAVIFIVVNNGMYGTIRMHQERDYPGRVYGTSLRNPDFAAYARAFGAHGETVEETGEFAPAFERCVASGKTSLIEVRLDPQAITTQTTLDAIRAKALAGR